MPPSTEPPSRTSTPRAFTQQSASAEDMLKSQTIGLVNLSDFRKRRAEVFEQKEREAHDKSLGIFTTGTSRTTTPSQGELTDGASTPASASSDGRPKKKKKALAKSKLSFGDDEDEAEPDTAIATTTKSKSVSKRTAEGTPTLPGRKIIANPNAPPPPKAQTKAALEAEAQARESLRKEFLAIQDAIKATEIVIPFVFYDGTNIPAGSVKLKKGDHVWLFLDRCRKVGAELGVAGAQGNGRMKRDSRREWARVGVDDLMLVRGDIIIPHHYEFYYFIANKIPSFSSAGGLMFDFSNEAPPQKEYDPLSRPNNEEQLEGADADPTLTKVVDRRWYERNKHIFPASLWREYEQGDEFLDKMKSTRRDAQGNVFFF
ncbi:protein FAM50 [Talaromyces islandicus]|uniref:Protein FAM50 n=1 Tax=Talaromyces islandicus TaxID=28573 RepID=A0A0U1LLM3_TALIS|nr:protein FAM50 [Talaromyces islandicus]